MPLHSSGYTQEEDMLLCQIYMEISQDPITGVYQSSDRLWFWSRVLEAYVKEKNPTWNERLTKSIKCRIQTVEKVTKKLHACIKKGENRCPSGASSDDIVSIFFIINR